MSSNRSRFDFERYLSRQESINQHPHNVRSRDTVCLCDLIEPVHLVGVGSDCELFVVGHSASHASEKSASAKSSARPVICFNLSTSSGSMPSSAAILFSLQLRRESS